MLRREKISILLLTIYVALMILPALVAITCPCTRDSKAEHHCCSAIHKHINLCDVGAKTSFAKGCDCMHSHSTEVALYTFAPQRDGLDCCSKITFVSLLAALFVEQPQSDFEWSLMDYVRLRAEKLKPLYLSGAETLRAPPVLA